MFHSCKSFEAGNMASENNDGLNIQDSGINRQ